MSKTTKAVALQARRIHCPRCGNRYWPKPDLSPGHRLRDFLLRIYRDRCRHPGLASDVEGRIFLMLLLALGLPLDDVDNHASIGWEELGALKEMAKRFDPTPENISKAIRFTDAEREHYATKYGLYLVRSCESDWHVEHQERTMHNDEKRNEKRRDRRQAERANLIAACRDEKEVAVIEVMLRIARRPGLRDTSVPTIIRTITSDRKYNDVFPQEHDAHRAAVHHALNRLTMRRVIETETCKRVRHATLIPQEAPAPARTGTQAKPSADQAVRPNQPMAQAKI